MELQWRDGGSEARFAACVEELSRVMGHADRLPGLVAQQTIHSVLGVGPLPTTTVGRHTPARRATSRTGSRPAECRTIRARCTCFNGRRRSPTTAGVRAQSSASTITQISWAMTTDSHGSPKMYIL